MRLFRDHEPLGAFDAVLAATAQARPHIQGLVSADRAYADVPRLVHHDPASEDFLPGLGLA